MHVDRPRLPAARVDPPHARKDLVARDRAARVLRQVAEQFHFLLRKLRPPAAVEVTITVQMPDEGNGVIRAPVTHRFVVAIPTAGSPIPPATQ